MSYQKTGVIEMKNNEDSSLLQGDEDRLDSLSGAEMNKKDSENDQTKVIS